MSFKSKWEHFLEMNETSALVSSLRHKINQLMDLNTKLLEEAEKDRLEIDLLKRSILEQKLQIDRLSSETMNRDRGEGKDLNGVKLKIDDIVREIDKCVSQLNS